MLARQKFSLRMIVLLGIAPLAAESATAAAPVDEVPSVAVRYHDLNLNSQEGIASLYERIHAAAVDVCKFAEGPQVVNRAFSIESDACISHEIAHAVHAVHNEKLSAYHRELIRGWKFLRVGPAIKVAMH